MTITIVSDTGCDLPPALVDQYGIHLVPLVLRFGEQEVRDTPETRAELWRRVEAGLPNDTSGPPVGAYEATFAPLMAAGHEVVCITLTGTHSVTYNSAWVAAQAFPERITVIDGRSVSIGYGLQALEAARLAAAGANRVAITAAVQSLQSRIMIRFFLESLEQVKRGGRLDALMPMLNRLGQTLDVRTVLTVNEQGRISLVGPARGRRGAIKRLLQDAIATAPVEQVVVAHTWAAEEADALAGELATELEFPREQIYVVEAGSVFIAHAGKGMMGAGTVSADQLLADQAIGSLSGTPGRRG